MQHGATGQALDLGYQPLALRFADRDPRLADESRATAPNEDTLVGCEDVTEEGDVAGAEFVGGGLSGPRPKTSRYSLMQRLSRAGISPIMTSEIPDLFDVGRLAEYGISHLCDNVVLLQYLRTDSRLLRTVTILKSRASAHEPDIRAFDITSDGIVLGDPIGEHVSR